jgi:dihydrodipicolinate synthase/N-acetylneuraminate lyase
VVGTGHADRDEAVRLTEAAREAGADAALTLSVPGREDHGEYYAAVAEAAGDMPVLAYHFPQISPPGIRVEQLPELPVAGVKDSSGDAERLVAELDAFDGPVYVGSSALLALAGPLGAAGAIVGLANTDPELCIAAFTGDLDVQRALVPAHLEAGADFPAGLKRRLARLGGTSAAVRRGSPVGR